MAGVAVHLCSIAGLSVEGVHIKGTWFLQDWTTGLTTELTLNLTGRWHARSWCVAGLWLVYRLWELCNLLRA